MAQPGSTARVTSRSPNPGLFCTPSLGLNTRPDYDLLLMRTAAGPSNTEQCVLSGWQPVNRLIACRARPGDVPYAVTGANIKSLQKSASLTLDRSGHLYDSDVDAVGLAMNTLLTGSSEVSVGDLGTV
jgi:hypothetical protein